MSAEQSEQFDVGSEMVLDPVNWDIEVPDRYIQGARLSGLSPGVQTVFETNFKKPSCVRRYDKSIHVKSYYHMMNGISHTNILKADNIYEEDGYDVIAFEPVHTTLRNFITNNAKSLMTTGPENHATDFAPLAKNIIKQVRDGLENAHRAKEWHGHFTSNDILLAIDEAFCSTDDRYVTVKLAFRYHEDCGTDMKKNNHEQDLQRGKQEDFKDMGHLINSFLNPDLFINTEEIEYFAKRLIGDEVSEDEKITHWGQFSEEPSLWSVAQRSLCLIGGFQLLTHDGEFESLTWSPISYVEKYRSVIELMPEDDDNPNNESHRRFDKLVTNVIKHLDDPDEDKASKLKSIVGENRGCALRFFRHHHPLLFPDLIWSCKYHAKEYFMPLLAEIKGAYNPPQTASTSHGS